MKRAELKRGAPLVARTPLARSSMPLRRVPMAVKAPRPAVTPKARKTLRARSGGVCEMRNLLAPCSGRAAEVSHRIKRGAGGRHGEAREANGRMSNLIHACSPCHRWVHANPEAAGQRGWILTECQDPRAVPALINDVPSYLDDDGGVTPCAY